MVMKRSGMSDRANVPRHSDANISFTPSQLTACLSHTTYNSRLLLLSRSKIRSACDSPSTRLARPNAGRRSLTRAASACRSVVGCTLLSGVASPIRMSETSSPRRRFESMLSTACLGASSRGWPPSSKPMLADRSSRITALMRPSSASELRPFTTGRASAIASAATIAVRSASNNHCRSRAPRRCFGSAGGRNIIAPHSTVR